MPTNTAKAKAHAVVVGLDCFTGVQTARILAYRGVPVTGIVKNPDHFCARTNVCIKKIATDTSSDLLIETLEKLGPSLDEKAVLFPCSDTCVSLISQYRDRLARWYHINLPAVETVEMLMDKMAFFEFAQNQGLPVPKAYFLRSRPDTVEAAGKLNYPCIFKPPCKTPEWEENSKKKVYKAKNADELIGLYDRYASLADIFMAQEWVDGTDADLYSCNCYFDEKSEPLVTFVAKKLRQWPPEAGTSCLGEECRNDEVLETTIKLFKSVGYQGLGYVEMKKDRTTGKHYIIEPNIGRPTGRSAIAEAGGVELLYTDYCHATGLPLPTTREQQYNGVKWIYLRRDVQSALFYWKRGDLTLKQWWQSWRGKKGYALFSWRDPKPFFGDLARVVRLALKPKEKTKPKNVKVKESASSPITQGITK